MSEIYRCIFCGYVAQMKWVGMGVLVCKDCQETLDVYWSGVPLEKIKAKPELDVTT